MHAIGVAASTGTARARASRVATPHRHRRARTQARLHRGEDTREEEAGALSSLPLREQEIVERDRAATRLGPLRASEHLEPAIEAIDDRAAKVLGLDRGDGVQIRQVEETQHAGLTGRYRCQRLWIEDRDAAPGRCQLAQRPASPQMMVEQRRIVELRAQLGHAVLVDEVLRRDTERLRVARIELIARHFARAPLEATGIHQAAARRQSEAQPTLVAVIEEVDERE